MWLNVWDGLKNKICRYLLQRYLGRFLDDKLRLEQFKIELYNGKAKVQNVILNVETLNEFLHDQGLGIEVVGGHIGELIVTVPWNALMISNSSIEVTNLVIRLRPIQRQSNGSSMLESMWCSLSSSMQLAEECFKQDPDITDKCTDAQVQVIDGIEKFAETIDNVLNRITAKFTNTTIRLELLLPNEDLFLCLHTSIKDFYYKNESGIEVCSAKASQCQERTNVGNKNIHLLPTFAKHSIECSGIKIFTEEYSESDKNCSFFVSPSNAYNMTSSLIPFLEIKGKQKVIIQVKQSDEINGPKIQLDLDFGTVHSILTPRQVHMVLNFWERFCEEETLDHTQNNANNFALRSKMKNPGNIMNLPGGAFSESLLWGEPTENYSNEKQSIVCENVSQILQKQNCVDESLASTKSTTTWNARQQKLTKMLPCGEIVKFNIRVASCALFVLHEDITTENSSSSKCRYFSRLSELFHKCFNEWEEKLNKDGRLTLLSLEKRNHIFFFLSSIILDGIQQRYGNVLILKLSGTSAKMYVDEVLEGISKPIVMVNHEENSCRGYQRSPDILFSMKSTSSPIESLNKSSWDIAIERCVLEVDISIYDRLSALLVPTPFLKPVPFKFSNEREKKKNSTEVNIVWQYLQINLRFPIVNKLPVDDHNDWPWWKQNIREDFLELSICQMRCTFAEKHYDFVMSTIDVYYCEDPKSKINFLRANILSLPSPKLNCDIEKLRVGILLQPNKISAQSSEKLTPFSTQRLCRQSDTVNKKKGVPEYDTMLLPGNNDELQLFAASTMKNSTIQITICLPNVTTCFESKHFYEVLYNRINYNLLMWEPRSPLFDVANGNQQAGHHLRTSAKESCQFNKSESAHDDSERQNIGNQSNRQNITTFPVVSANLQEHEKKQKNVCAIEILIREGTLSCLLPVRDEESNLVPEKSGRIDIYFNKLQLFIVNGYCGNICLDYVSLRTKEFEMFHCGVVPENFNTLACDTYALPPFMNLTICKVPEGTHRRDQFERLDRDMVSLAMEIKKFKKKMLKRIRATTALQTPAWHYKTELHSHVWINQIIDFLDVQDCIIDGYEPFVVLTEVQFHMLNFAVSYRPENFPFRVVLEAGMLSISSNLISANQGCTLRCILEDLVLEIGRNVDNAEHQKRQSDRLWLENLVPVCDVGLIDISIRLNNETLKKNPKVDLRCSIHDANLRTCSDSGIALAQIIAYIAQSCIGNKYSDDESPSENGKEDQQHILNEMMADALRDTKTTYPNTVSNIHQANHPKEFCFPDEMFNYNQGEYTNTENPSSLNDFFTFESNVMSQVLEPKDLNLRSTAFCATKDRGPVSQSQKRQNISDEEYCIISEDEILLPIYGAQKVDVQDEPLRMVDNHFKLPQDTPDLLSPPDSFPTAETRYTICEMTFTWHLYGGQDFPQEQFQMKDHKYNTAKSKMSEAYKYGVSQDRSCHNIKSNRVSGNNLTWKTKGGPERNHRVIVEIFFNKIRFSHEVYPVHTTQASRQVFLVHDLEIRDRLEASEINKLLYHPNFMDSATKATKHVLAIKALHLRTKPGEKADEECTLRISLLPLRLHIDQDTLIFLVEYFIDISVAKSPISNDDTENRRLTKSDKDSKTKNPIIEMEKLDAQNQDHFIKKDTLTTSDIVMDNAQGLEVNSNPECFRERRPTFFRVLVFSPEVSIRLDYHGRRVELSRGPIAGLLLGLGQLRCSEIRLRELIYRRGLLGIERLITYMCKEWLQDIKCNQLPSILSAVGPAYAFIQLFYGVFDLFWMPIEQYQKDGRLIRGIQLGAESFTARTALAALEITSKVIYLLQITAETAFEMVSQSPRKRRGLPREMKNRPSRANNIREGMTNAFLIVKEGINDSAANLIESASVEHDHKGYTGVVGAVVRQIPQLVVCPAVLATQATTNILGGMKNSLLPEERMEARDKWKKNSK